MHQARDCVGALLQLPGDSFVLADFISDQLASLFSFRKIRKGFSIPYEGVPAIPKHLVRRSIFPEGFHRIHISDGGLSVGHAEAPVHEEVEKKHGKVLPMVPSGHVLNMFAKVARGEQNPEDAARTAEAEYKRIFNRRK